MLGVVGGGMGRNTVPVAKGWQITLALTWCDMTHSWPPAQDPGGVTPCSFALPQCSGLLVPLLKDTSQDSGTGCVQAELYRGVSYPPRLQCPVKPGKVQKAWGTVGKPWH